MRSGAFYLLLYFHPIAKILLTIVCRVCGFLAVITLVGMFFNDSWVGIIVIAALFFLVSISACQQRFKTDTVSALAAI